MLPSCRVRGQFFSGQVVLFSSADPSTAVPGALFFRAVPFMGTEHPLAQTPSPIFSSRVLMEGLSEKPFLIYHQNGHSGSVHPPKAVLVCRTSGISAPSLISFFSFFPPPSGLRWPCTPNRGLDGNFFPLFMCVPRQMFVPLHKTIARF